jgi:serine/threonine protein kinase
MIETLPAGTVLRGRYRIERILGSGGFGHVYQALDLQSKQLFAVKEYLVTGASGKAQLEHEARVLSQLHHPNLPAFQDAFDERGRYYIVLGYIEGRDLTDCLRMVRQKNEALPYERILPWMIAICDAVTFLHNHHPPVIHRDIKPDNIRITPDGTAILVDLGNAKAVEDGARTLFFIRHQGTPGYAPLEQYPGGPGTDARSDVYALGGTLYFALTGQEPPSVSARNAAISQKKPDLPSLQEILAQNPPASTADPNAGRQFRLGISRPSKPAPRHSSHIAQLGTLPPDLLNRLNDIIQRAMAMRPQDRYQSVAEMSNDLRAVLAALPASRPPSPPQGRPFDPHSTQPDLPFLVEAWQKAHANQDAQPNQQSQAQPAQHTPGQSTGQPEQPARRPDPSPPPSPATPPVAMTRCPNCQAEVPLPATFCPRCGQALNRPAPRNVQGESTMQRKTNSGPPGSSAPRPFLQTVPPTLQASSEVKVTRPSQVVQSAPHTSASMPVPLASPAAPSPTPALGNRSVLPTGNSTQKLFLYAVLAFGIVLLIIILLIVSHLGAGHTGAFPPHAGPSLTEEPDHERDITLRAAAAIASGGAGLWKRGARLPATAGIAQ